MTFVREMTAANVRESPDRPATQVVFLDSARIYLLPRTNPNHDAIVARLRRAAMAGVPLQIVMDSETGSTIEDVRDVQDTGR